MTSLNEICVTQKIALHELLTCTSAVISKPFLLLTSPLLLCVVSDIEQMKIVCEMILKKEIITEW